MAGESGHGETLRGWTGHWRWGPEHRPALQWCAESELLGEAAGPSPDRLWPLGSHAVDPEGTVRRFE